jgi:DNA-binding NtrC family response regulator
MLSSEMGLPAPRISAEAISVLESHSFPGNARELKNAIEGALIRSSGREIEPKHITFADMRMPDKSAPGKGVAQFPADISFNVRELEKAAVRRAMERTGGNVSAAARLLGIGRTKLYRKLPQTEAAVHP